MTKKAIWVLPESIEDLFLQTLQMDATSSMFDIKLRAQLQRGLDRARRYGEEEYRRLILKEAKEAKTK